MTTYLRGDVLIKTLPQRISDGTYRGLVVVTAHTDQETQGTSHACEAMRDKAGDALQDADAYVALHHPTLARSRSVIRL